MKDLIERKTSTLLLYDVCVVVLFLFTKNDLLCIYGKNTFFVHFQIAYIFVKFNIILYHHSKYVFASPLIWLGRQVLMKNESAPVIGDVSKVRDIPASRQC